MNRHPIGCSSVPSLGTRDEVLERLRAGQDTAWDVIVVGGGATGLGTAVDAASRGWRTLLLEAHDYASGTSSKATKLLHGGVRYLAQGNISLVREALHERDLLLRNAPGLTAPLDFVIPAYRWHERYWYGAGMKVYDALAGSLSLSRSRLLSRADTLARLPSVRADGLRGGVVYADGQFDDAALALALARTAAREGALVANYVAVESLVKDSQGRVVGVQARERETGERFRFGARCVVNATGVWVDELRRSDRPAEPAMVSPSQGVHLVLDRSFLPGQSAMLVPRTADGRVLFMVPWLGHALIGTTDTPRPDVELSVEASESRMAAPAPLPLADEVSFILETAGRYLVRAPALSDVRSAWAGLRPLVRPQGAAGHTAQVSREHTVLVAPSRLVSVTGGKWTTYRHMAQQVLDIAVAHGLLPARQCVTRALPLACGDDVPGVREKPADLDEPAVRTAILRDGALTVEDVLARRRRQLFLDAEGARRNAPWVAELAARLRGRDSGWAARQSADFERAAAGFRAPASVSAVQGEAG